VIVASIWDINKKAVLAKGSSRTNGYENWFPLTSAGFSFSSESDNTKSDIDKEKSSSDKKKEKENQVSCSKFVDAATSDLMWRSVCDKLQQRAESQSHTVSAYIHFLETATASLKSDDGKTSVIPFLMVALNDVTVESWGLSGSGDDRPTETFTLKFEGIAIQYTQYDEDGNQKPVNARGFNQKDLSEWKPETWKP
jgi:type VI protein secretion system component Hcp